jgi:hypothetical protein
VRRGFGAQCIEVLADYGEVGVRDFMYVLDLRYGEMRDLLHCAC